MTASSSSNRSSGLDQQKGLRYGLIGPEVGGASVLGGYANVPHDDVVVAFDEQ